MTDLPNRIESARSSTVAGSAPAQAATIEFARLMERLEAIAPRATTPKVTEVDEFVAAVQQADDDYVQVMDLRRRLEAAFRDQIR